MVYQDYASNFNAVSKIIYSTATRAINHYNKEINRMESEAFYRASTENSKDYIDRTINSIDAARRSMENATNEEARELLRQKEARLKKNLDLLVNFDADGEMIRDNKGDIITDKIARDSNGEYLVNKDGDYVVGRRGCDEEIKRLQDEIDAIRAASLKSGDVDPADMRRIKQNEAEMRLYQSARENLPEQIRYSFDSYEIAQMCLTSMDERGVNASARYSPATGEYIIQVSSQQSKEMEDWHIDNDIPSKRYEPLPIEHTTAPQRDLGNGFMNALDISLYATEAGSTQSKLNSLGAAMNAIYEHTSTLSQNKAVLLGWDNTYAYAESYLAGKTEQMFALTNQMDPVTKEYKQVELFVGDNKTFFDAIKREYGDVFAQNGIAPPSYGPDAGKNYFPDAFAAGLTNNNSVTSYKNTVHFYVNEDLGGKKHKIEVGYDANGKAFILDKNGKLTKHQPPVGVRIEHRHHFASHKPTRKEDIFRANMINLKGQVFNKYAGILLDKHGNFDFNGLAKMSKEQLASLGISELDASIMLSLGLEGTNFKLTYGEKMILRKLGNAGHIKMITDISHVMQRRRQIMRVVKSVKKTASVAKLHHIEKKLQKELKNGTSYISKHAANPRKLKKAKKKVQKRKDKREKLKKKAKKRLEKKLRNENKLRTKVASKIYNIRHAPDRALATIGKAWHDSILGKAFQKFNSLKMKFAAFVGTLIGIQMILILAFSVFLIIIICITSLLEPKLEDTCAYQLMLSLREYEKEWTQRNTNDAYKVNDEYVAIDFNTGEMEYIQGANKPLRVEDYYTENGRDLKAALPRLCPFTPEPEDSRLEQEIPWDAGRIMDVAGSASQDHTSNIKDIICMADVMFFGDLMTGVSMSSTKYDINKARTDSDAEINQQIEFDKMTGNFNSTEIYASTKVTYEQILNYCTRLFELSHFSGLGLRYTVYDDPNMWVGHDGFKKKYGDATLNGKGVSVSPEENGGTGHSTDTSYTTAGHNVYELYCDGCEELDAFYYQLKTATMDAPLGLGASGNAGGLGTLLEGDGNAYGNISEEDLTALAMATFIESVVVGDVDNCQRDTASVIINNSRRLGKSIYDTVTSGAYGKNTREMVNGLRPDLRARFYASGQRALSNVKYILEHGCTVPSNVIYQTTKEDIIKFGGRVLREYGGLAIGSSGPPTGEYGKYEPVQTNPYAKATDYEYDEIYFAVKEKSGNMIDVTGKIEMKPTDLKPCLTNGQMTWDYCKTVDCWSNQYSTYEVANPNKEAVYDDDGDFLYYEYSFYMPPVQDMADPTHGITYVEHSDGGSGETVTVERMTWKCCGKHNAKYCKGHLSQLAGGYTVTMTEKQMDPDQEEKFPGKLDAATIDYSSILNVVNSGKGDTECANGLNIALDGDHWRHDSTNDLPKSTLFQITRQEADVSRCTKENLAKAKDIFDIDMCIDYCQNAFGIPKYKDFESWDMNDMQHAAVKMTMDWKDTYGFDCSLMAARGEPGPLPDEFVNTISDCVKEAYGDLLTPLRKRTIDVALSAVGTGRYDMDHHYHGFLGICSEKGGICNITDCSGFVSYVFNQTGAFKGQVFCTTDLTSPATGGEASVWNKNLDELLPGDAIVYHNGRSASEGGSAHTLIFIGKLAKPKGPDGKERDFTFNFSRIGVTLNMGGYVFVDCTTYGSYDGIFASGNGLSGGMPNTIRSAPNSGNTFTESAAQSVTYYRLNMYKEDDEKEAMKREAEKQASVKKN